MCTNKLYEKKNNKWTKYSSKQQWAQNTAEQSEANSQSKVFYVCSVDVYTQNILCVCAVVGNHHHHHLLKPNLHNNKNARILDTSSSPALHFIFEQNRVERRIWKASRNPTIPRLGRELMGESIYILPYEGRSMSVIKFTFDIFATVYVPVITYETDDTK